MIIFKSLSLFKNGTFRGIKQKTVLALHFTWASTVYVTSDADFLIIQKKLILKLNGSTSKKAVFGSK